MAKANTLTSNLMLARSYVKLNAPYYSSTLYGFVPTPIENLTRLAGGPLAVTAQLVLLYEPAWTESVSTKVLASGLAHEIMHHQLRHVSRGKVYTDQRRFNYAGDLVINQLLRKQTRTMKKPDGSTTTVPLWELEPSWLVPEKFGLPEGLTADQYYDLLLNKKLPEPTFSCGCCGGVAGNGSKTLEDQFNEVKGRSLADCVNIARVTAQQIKQKMDGEGRGKMPGDWFDFVNMSEDKFNIPWRKELPNVLRVSIGNIRAGGHDYSMRRPSPRSYLRGWPLPGLVSYEPEIAFVLDSSGSMGKEQLEEAQRIFCDVLTQTGITHAWYLEADAAMHRVPQRIRVRDLRKMRIKGGGGTSFRPAIKMFEERRTPGVRVPKIDLLFYCTDGDGDAPPVAPKNFKVIWCIVRSAWSREAAPWGKTIFIDDQLANVPKPEATTLYMPNSANIWQARV